MDELSPEILAKIFSHLPAKDVASVSLVSRKLHDSTRIEAIWRSRCLREYGILPLNGDGVSHRELYIKVLYPYGNILGLWQPQVASYGGLLQVKFEKSRRSLEATELLPPRDPDILSELRKKPLFKIQLSGGQTKVVCVGGNREPHKAEISKVRQNEFIFRCCNPDLHKHPSGRHEDLLLAWLREESSAPLGSFHLFPHTQELLMMKFLILRQFNFNYQYCRIHAPKVSTKVPIKPGIFKGTYGAHGVELIMLSYEEHLGKAKAVKITGDPNVPAGKVSFQVDLNYWMVLTVSQQHTIGDLEAIIPSSIHGEDVTERPLRQPFRVPRNCHQRYHEVPDTCRARYHGLGQVAAHGFANPSFIPGHWIIFNEDFFGFLWLELMTLGVYHRVQEDLS
ncbi:F-box only protein 31-like [Tachypleus tridentatus]|uniref:F-box only protein 31-like n=1 Tax=Tachypleus tridentatus TaxID=6853 RepID=UPI003FD3B9C7